MRSVLTAAAAAVLLLASTASAQVPAFDLERLSLDPAAVSSMVVGTAEVHPEGQGRTSAALHYESRPLVQNEDGTVRGGGFGAPGTRFQNVVGNRLTAHIGVSVAPTSRFELNLRLPIIAWQEGAAGLTGTAKVAASGFGAPAFGARYVLLQQGEGQAVSVAVASEAILPFGSKDALAGTDRWSFTPRVEVGHRYDGFVVGAQAGALMRQQKTTFPVDTNLQSEFQVGAVVATTGAPLRGELSVRGSLGPEIQRTMEVLAGARFAFCGGWEAFALGGPGFHAAPGTPRYRGLIGLAYAPAPKKAAPAPAATLVDPCAAGQAHSPAQCPALDDDKDGILNKDDTCPLVAGIAEAQGCPAKDSDGDGVFDHLDECPAVAGLAELKGCPSKDSDGDGVADHQDKCPAVKGLPADGGCPPAMASLNAATGKIDILEKVYFDTGKATIQDRSFPVLDAVAKVLAANPQITKVSIEGHTDATGSAKQNTKLSADRAAAVKAYLVGKGVEGGRLEPKGFGSSRPVADEKTAEGRDQNRRVEFVLP